MFIVYDNRKNGPMTDPYGHFKVYSSKQSAISRARSENNAGYPKTTRYSVTELTYYVGRNVWKGRPPAPRTRT